MNTHMYISTLPFLTCCLAGAGVALAQVTKTPAAQAKILEIGQKFDPEVIQQILDVYLPLQRRAPRDGVKITRDLRYGPDARHLLDVHQPEKQPATPMPIVVFIHGGGFIGGEKSRDGLIYDNIATYFARHGMLGVNATYRLAPRHQWPSGAEDLGRMLQWIRTNGAQYGGDPGRIFLFGHSAGASHVATYIFHEEFQINGGDDGVAGAILMSGQYEPKKSAFDDAYYGKDHSQYSDRAAINHIDGRKVPLFIIFAEFDPHEMEMASLKLIEAICRRDGHCPRFARVAGHNHLSESTHINTEDESIGPEILEFIRTGR